MLTLRKTTEIYSSWFFFHSFFTFCQFIHVIHISVEALWALCLTMPSVSVLFTFVMTMHRKQTPLQFVVGFIITSYQTANGRVTIWLNSINLFFPSFTVALNLKQLSLKLWYSHFTIQHSCGNSISFFWQRRHLFETFRWIYFTLMNDGWWLKTRRKKYIDRKQSVGNSKLFK